MDETDAELVGLSLAGDRAAFGRIVARHQSLVCALAYSAVGNLALSEDLAQDTFLAAWRQLPALREPANLRGWLCGIVRHLAQEARRQQGRDPTHAAEPIHTAETLSTSEPSAPAQAVRHDEEDLLWQALGQVPDIYREPLVLFYRQHQSVEAVAVALELSTDAVKQRLSRGRKLLQEQVLALVEGTLTRTNPGSAFTANVLAALPVAAAKTLTATATVAKGALATSLKGGAGALLGPLAGGGLAWIGAVASLQSFRSGSAFEPRLNLPPNRIFTRLAGNTLPLVIWAALFVTAHEYANSRSPIGALAFVLLGLMFVDERVAKDARQFWALTGQGKPAQSKFRRVLRVAAVFLAVAGLMFLSEFYGAAGPGVTLLLILLWMFLGVIYSVWMLGHPSSLPPADGSPDSVPAPAGNESKTEETTAGNPNLIATHEADTAAFEYRSQRSFLGLPLVHINHGRTPEGRARVAKGWLASGSRAYGVVAIGGVAVGVVSMGVFAVGAVVIFGGVAVGPVAVGALAVGWRAIGGIALGGQAVGGLALAWNAAYGGWALAREAATGGAAVARHANDLTALRELSDNGFLDWGRFLLRYVWEMLLLWLLYLWTVTVIKKGAGLPVGKPKPAQEPDTPETAFGLEMKAQSKRVRADVVKLKAWKKDLQKRRGKVMVAWHAASGVVLAGLVLGTLYFADYPPPLIPLGFGAFVLVLAFPGIANGNVPLLKVLGTSLGRTLGIVAGSGIMLVMSLSMDTGIAVHPILSVAEVVGTGSGLGWLILRWYHPQIRPVALDREELSPAASWWILGSLTASYLALVGGMVLVTNPMLGTPGGLVLPPAQPQHDALCFGLPLVFWLAWMLIGGVKLIKARYRSLEAPLQETTRPL